MNLSNGRYKVKLRNIFASNEFSGLDKCPKAYLGVSMNNPIFWHKSFELVVDWCVENFEKPYILVGDYLNRWNELIFFSNSETECIERTAQESARFRNSIQHLSNIDKLQELNWLELYNTTEFEAALSSVVHSYNTNVLFRESIVISAAKFINNRIKLGKRPIVSQQKAEELSIHYLMEELSIFLVLIGRDIPVQIYPGSQLPVLHAIHTKTDMKAPKLFQKGVFVELRVKKL